MQKLLLIFILLLSAASFAQTTTTYYTSTVQVTPGSFPYEYGLAAMAFNQDASHVAYLDTVKASAYAIGTEDINAYFAIGFGFTSSEESNCVVAPVFQFAFDPTPQPLSSTVLRVSSQPCRPNGLPYGLQPNGTFNSNTTNMPANLDACAGYSCSTDLSKHPLAIPPGRGVSVYISSTKNGNWISWLGDVFVTFTWHTIN